jgi:Cd2+/Zn2+-exporting ATPase
VENVNVNGGKGIRCEIDGHTALFGNEKLMADNGIYAPRCEMTCIYGALDGKLLGRLDFSSRLKDGVADTVRALYGEGIERIAVVSGDNESAVGDVCESIGISEYYASQTPDQKLDVLSEIIKTEKGKGYVAFCGDGLNDSAAIAAADVGIAMGGCGSALTVESADVVLMDDDPEKIRTAIRISKRTSRVATCNIALSLGIKIAVLLASVTLAYFGIDAPIELAVVADVGAAVIAVLNSLRAAKREKI